jgi:hypothetical protein
MDKEKKRKEMELFDMGLVAYLYLKNHKFLRFERHTDNIVSFVFEYTPELQKDVSDYEEMKGQVAPRPYINLFRNLRQQVIGLKRKNGMERDRENEYLRYVF